MKPNDWFRNWFAVGIEMYPKCIPNASQMYHIACAGQADSGTGGEANATQRTRWRTLQIVQLHSNTAETLPRSRSVAVLAVDCVSGYTDAGDVLPITLRSQRVHKFAHDKFVRLARVAKQIWIGGLHANRPKAFSNSQTFVTKGRQNVLGLMAGKHSVKTESEVEAHC